MIHFISLRFIINIFVFLSHINLLMSKRLNWKLSLLKLFFFAWNFLFKLAIVIIFFWFLYCNCILKLHLIFNILSLYINWLLSFVLIFVLIDLSLSVQMIINEISTIVFLKMILNFITSEIISDNWLFSLQFFKFQNIYFMGLLGNFSFMSEIFFSYLIFSVFIDWHNTGLLRLFIPTLLIAWWIRLVNILFSLTYFSWKIPKLAFFDSICTLIDRLLLNRPIIPNTSLPLQRIISFRFQGIIRSLISIVNIRPSFQACF